MRLKDVMIRVVRPSMIGNFRKLLLAALLAPALFVANAPVHAQEKAGPPDDDGVAVPSDVGPLRGFTLPGERTSTPAPKVTPPPPVTEPEPAATAPQPAPEEPARATAPSRQPTTQPPATSSRTPAPADTHEQTPATGIDRTQAETQPREPGPTTPELSAPPVEQSAPIEVQTPTSATAPVFSWTYLLLALIAGVAVLAGVIFLRTRTAREEAFELGAPQLAAEPQLPPRPAPLPEPAPAPVAQRPAPAMATPRASTDGGVVGIQIRPWLQLDFKPDRVAATATETTVQFELLVSNVGNATAKNIRIEARMFNAGSEQDFEIADFFKEPLDERNSSRILAIPPRKGARVRAGVAMPKEAVREITVEGRRLFIPLVAFNVLYEWGDGKTGQTSMSYLVGREAEAPSEKMGAFRLDLGPRVYRSLGQRPSEVAVRV